MAQASPVVQQRVDPELIYQTIREEIIDQQRCQFKLLSLAVTMTAGVLAYGAANGRNHHDVPPMCKRLLSKTVRR